MPRMKRSVEFHEQAIGGKLMRGLLRMDVPLHLHCAQFAAKCQTVTGQVNGIFRRRLGFLARHDRAQ